MNPVREIDFGIQDTGGGAEDVIAISAPPAAADMFAGYGDMLTVSDLAAILGVHKKTVQHQCARGDLPAVMIGRRWYVAKARLAELMMTGQNR